MPRVSRRMLSAACLIVAMASAAQSQEAPAPPARYQRIRGVPYGAGDTMQTIDVYLPDSSVRRSTAVFLLNFGSGNKFPFVQRFAERGYEASPITWVDRNDPPFLLVHRTADGCSPHSSRSATAGSSRAARAAGSRPASRVTAATASAATTRVPGSLGERP